MKGVRIRGGTSLYNGRVGAWGLFGLKTLCPFIFGVESGMVFEGTTGAYMNGRIYRFNSK